MSEPSRSEPSEPQLSGPQLSEPGPSPLSAEDQKLLTLARAARARTGVAQGAAVRDGDGRTYAGATVTLPSLRLTALQFAVAAAVAAGAGTLEAAAVVGAEPTADDAGRAAVRDLAPGVPLHLAGPDGVRAATVEA